MLLTITYRGKPATDLGYLLHKNPSRAQKFELNTGNAYVFYPKAEEDECTAALLIDLNPIDLARGKVGSTEGGLFDYVNDRPYVASSFMSTALSRVFSTAMAGRCANLPELAASAIDLEANVTMLPCRGDPDLIRKIFEPLGYEVTFERFALDEKFPEWGESDYVNLTIRGKVRLCDLLNHLYVLIPAFDHQKHYWMGEDEVEKLLRHGEGWLSSHPEMKRIARRYFNKKKNFASLAIERLIDREEIESAVEETVVQPEAEPTAPQPEPEILAVPAKRLPLNEQRLEAVVRAIRDSGAATVADLGCGEGALLSKLLREGQITKLIGMDVSVYALERAKEKLRLDQIAEFRRDKVALFQGSLTYRDKRIEGLDAACVVEVIEHMDADRLGALERVVFEFASPKTVVVTTPNAEYNENYKSLAAGRMRHPDHRFEWTRAEFRAWAERVCARFGYTVALSEIGESDEAAGAPTQIGVFSKCG